MTSSSSSSSSESTASSSVPLSSIKLPPSLSQYNFDPLALHPFTSYASPNPNGNTQAVSCNHHSNPYRQSPGGYPSPHAPITASLSTTATQQQSPQKPFAYTPPRPAGVFVPFRKDTSSPELSDILKPKSKSSADVSKTFPMNMATLIPAVPSVGLSGSRKH